MSDLTHHLAAYRTLCGAEISPELTSYFVKLCDELRPTSILDTGTGWSSFLFRKVCPDAFVLSVDDNESWLAKTIEFCAQQGVSTDNIVMWRDVDLTALSGHFDLVSHDLGGRQTRVATLPDVIKMTRPGGVLVLDDMHKDDLRRGTEEILMSHGLEWTSLADCTLDCTARYAYRVNKVTNET